MGKRPEVGECPSILGGAGRNLGQLEHSKRRGGFKRGLEGPVPSGGLLGLPLLRRAGKHHPISVHQVIGALTCQVRLCWWGVGAV